MPRYSVVVVCEEEHPQHAEVTLKDLRLGRKPKELHTTDQTILGYVLQTHIGNFKRNYGCPDAGGSIRTEQDLPELKIRKGTTVVECRGNVANYLPYLQVCSNCGWRCDSGTVMGDGEFFCWNKACWDKSVEQFDAKKRVTIAKHRSEGLCIFDQAWIGLCSNKALTGHSVCSDHLGTKCHCGAQATRECSHAGSFVCGRPLCDEHKCPAHP